MKSYNQRQNEKLIREFVGPAGQTDPMAPTSNTTQMMQQFMRALGNQTPQQIAMIQQQFNNQVQQLIAQKKSTAPQQVQP